MKGVGYRCDHCGTTATVEERSPLAPGWVVLMHLVDNPFGSPEAGELHACCWLCAEAIAHERFDPGDGPVPDGIDGGVFMGRPS